MVPVKLIAFLCIKYLTSKTIWGGLVMKKSLVVAAVLAFASVFAFGSVAIADDLVPGAYAQQDQSVMSVGKTIMEMGARDRALTDAVNRASGAHLSRSSSVGVNVDYQFGSSQTDQSWKAQRTVEEASVRGLVPGDCQGDNSDDWYRNAMNQNRKGYTKEKLVSNADCEANHSTIQIGAAE